MKTHYAQQSRSFATSHRMSGAAACSFSCFLRQYPGVVSRQVSWPLSFPFLQPLFFTVPLPFLVFLQFLAAFSSVSQIIQPNAFSSVQLPFYLHLTKAIS
jgi:hypothetical protein